MSNNDIREIKRALRTVQEELVPQKMFYAWVREAEKNKVVKRLEAAGFWSKKKL